jgi:cation diffusion facilitator CzcD-associated flavoprotein CzcO
VSNSAGPTGPTESVDVLIVGAGLAGVGAAWRLRERRPDMTYAILEARDRIGGTWDLFRYPGVRSDSDMFTLSYPFRPWRGAKSIADGESIRAYIEETAAQKGIDRHIRFRTRVVSASWSSRDSRWTVETQVGDAPERHVRTCSFLYLCAGYYDYSQAYRPAFPGAETFRGRFIHPQFWPRDFNVAGSRVVVIGSGATAVTLVPSLSRTAAHVTMLQRSPSYLAVRPAADRTADVLRRMLPSGLAHRLIRAKNIVLNQFAYTLSRRYPEPTKRHLRRSALRFLPDAAYLARHFTPRYQPWDQRLCVVPDGDFFRALAAGDASVVTDEIRRFTEDGVELASGARLDADVVVCATGLSLLPLGGLKISVDGAPVDVADTVTYRGLMLSGVPNFAYCIGYANASWTLRADLSSLYVCRLLGFMKRHDVVAAVPNRQSPAVRRPLLKLDSGYVRRAVHLFPQQGVRAPWTVRQNYLLERLALGVADLRKDMTLRREVDRFDNERRVKSRG